MKRLHKGILWGLLYSIPLWAVILFGASWAWGTDYYVDNCDVTGNDSNNGTAISTPWLTTAKTAGTNIFVPGDNIFFRAGCTWSDSRLYYNSQSGTAVAPITFGRYGAGADPIIDSAIAKTSWTDEDAIFYKAYVSSPNQVWYDGSLLTRNQVSKATLATGQWWRDTGNKRVYIYDTPTAHTVAWSEWNSLVTNNNKSYLVYQDLELKRCNGANVGITGHAGTGSIIIERCTVSKAYTNGISIGAETSGGISSGAIVRNNAVSDNGIAMMLEGSTPYNIIGGHNTGSSTNYVTGTLIQGNTVSGATGGIKGDWFSDGFIIENNVVDSGGMSTDGGRNHTWRNNIVKNCAAGNKGLSIFHWEGAPGPPYSFSAVMTGFKVYNNVFYGCGNAGIMFWSAFGEFDITNTEVKNNIIYLDSASNSMVTVPNTGLSGVVIDNNLYYTGANTSNFTAVGATKTFAQWQALGYDTNGINVDPLFVSATNFHLQGASPAKAAGATLASPFNVDKDGVTLPTPGYGWPMGAYGYYSYGGGTGSFSGSIQ